jgi:HEAT repeat protein
MKNSTVDFLKGSPTSRQIQLFADQLQQDPNFDIDSLITHLSSKNVIVVCSAFGLISMLDKKIASQNIHKVVEHTNKLVRLFVFEHLRNITTPEETEVICIKLLNDSHGTTKWNACFELGECGSEKCIPHLEDKILYDKDSDYDGRPVSVEAKKALKRVIRRLELTRFFEKYFAEPTNVTSTTLQNFDRKRSLEP